jgi:XTP/dITP diphosphohydrolase
VTGDRGHLREELGDLLLQVVFHARIAQEDPQAPFGIDDVAAGIVAKLVRRHPHVFAEGAERPEVSGASDVERSWEQIKAVEKQREGLFDGIPVTLPALARAQKMLGRLDRAAPDGASPPPDTALAQAVDGDPVAARLLEVVLEARRSGTDAEAALRTALARLASAFA